MAAAAPSTYDLVIYGSTPAGIAAASSFRAAAPAHPPATIALLDPNYRVGGMVSSGLGNSDVRTAACLGGFPLDFFTRNARVYAPNASAPLFLLEPHVAERLFLDTLSDANVSVFSGVAGIESVVLNAGALNAVTTTSGLTFSGRYFVDASYEGDLIAAVGADCAVGREPRALYGEAPAGRLGDNYTFILPVDPYDARTGTLLPLMSTAPFAAEGDGDGLLQAYCFRLCVTNITTLRRPFPAPAAYNPADFELFRRWVAATAPSIESFFGYAFRIPAGAASAASGI